jgi:hypothetical protein
MNTIGLPSLGLAVVATLCSSVPGSAQEIGNGLVTVRAVKEGTAWTGFDLLSQTHTAAVVRLSSDQLVTAAGCTATRDKLVFASLTPKTGCGLQLGPEDAIQVTLPPGEPFPIVSFDLSIRGFDSNAWQSVASKQPFHFLALCLPEAEAWHQRGWLNATPLADPFPLLQDTHAGTPEISAYHYNRTWSYTPPLGAHPIPVVGLWAPRLGRYAGFEFQTTRLADNSEKDLATGYHWAEKTDKPTKPGQAQQFVALVYPSGGRGYQQLVFPKAGDRLASRGVLLWTNLESTLDPNRFFFGYLWQREKSLLPRVPKVVDLSWLPGGIRLADFEGPPGGGLIGGVEPPFQVAGSKVLNGWRWQNERPTQVAKARGDTARLDFLQAEAGRLLRYVKRFRVGDDDCVFWEKPLEGAWTPEWGGAPVTTLHNANGFAAGRLFLGLYRDLGQQEHLPIVDGVFNWAKHIAWTRNEFADVPSSPFAIGGTLSASFCLDYYFTFKDGLDAVHRAKAAQALDLARSFTYRYLVLWPSDNDRLDNRDSAFLWEPNSGRDWTGAACANEVFWNLDTLAQTAVHTGDPALIWALNGSLDRWHQLYQESYKDSLADYQPADMTEGYGLYAGNVYGVGVRAPYGFASPLAMIEPVGRSLVRVLVGEKAALAFNKHGAHTTIENYACTARGDFAFTLRSQSNRFDVSVTFPYADLSRKPVFRLRAGQLTALQQGTDFLRPAQALWSLYLKELNHGDRIIVGESAKDSPPLPAPALPSFGPDEFTVSTNETFVPMVLKHDAPADAAWENLNSWAGLPRGALWAYGARFVLAPCDQDCVVTRPLRFQQPVQNGGFVALLYSAGAGPRPQLACEDGEKLAPDASMEALGWRTWPPIYSGRLVTALVPTRGKAITGLDPGGRLVWAMSVLRSSAAPELSAIRRAYQEGGVVWQRMQAEEQAIAALKDEAASVPAGAIALLPPTPAGPAVNLAKRAGVLRRAVTLAPAQLVEPAQFSAKRFPVALYADGEDYVHTVRAAGDAAEALVRYVKEGGTLVLLSTQPWPMYYATGSGFHRPDSLTERLGLPLRMAIESAPADKLTVRMTPGQTVLPGVPAQFAYPTGDPRLRSIDRTKVPAGTKYASLYRVLGASGKDYGDAGGLIELPGGGRILYLWCGLLQDPDQGATITQAATRFLIRAANAARREPPPAGPGGPAGGS